MSDPADRNRLGDEESPYLRQHADNPVHWQPWDDAALDAARERDVPIFLSVGYSACHWCHVMEEESFTDDRVASVLNESFVPVKVDREERPDVDRIYQTICQLVSGGGGWPLSVWLTPDGRPFYVGTYFPREERRGMPGFLDVLGGLATSWREDREEIGNRADQWTAAIRDELESTPEPAEEAPDESILGSAATAALRSADRENGGFGTNGPKFPQPGRIELLLRSYIRSGQSEALDIAIEALDAMGNGGLYDHVGGGFHRYTTDPEWTVPHFEKMLYDNAEIPKALLAGYQVTGECRYARLTQETFAFVERELRHPDGGFYSTLDARSEGEEGKYYVWTPSGIREVLDGVDADLFCDRYGIRSGGNFEGGTTVLTVSASTDELAEEYGLEREEVTQRLMEARVAVFEARGERPRPARDEKVLAGWNGLMISAYALGARALDPVLARTAERALGFVRDELWTADPDGGGDGSGRLKRRYKDGDVKGDGYLEDYAFLGRGAFDLYQATGEPDHLAFALDLARTIVAEFWDEDAGTLYFTPASGEGLVTRPQELQDQSTPSSLGVAVGLLLDLAHFDPDAGFEEVVERALRTHANRIRGSPLEHVSLALAADEFDRGPLELTLAADEVLEDWRDALSARYLPDAVVSQRPSTDDELEEWLDGLGLDEAPPIWKGREAVDGEPTVYACRSFTCSPPETDIRAALDWAAER
jgi:uncharacterized protein YyaL (SSP411 family)